MFQEQICDYFNSLGAEAETNVTLKGVRTKHDIDIVVRTKFLGQRLTWIVEAKYWNRKVTKSHVLTLRSIADDLGVDRAFIVSKAGFQSGAIDAAENTNVRLKTMSELKSETKGLIEFEIIKTYDKRLSILEDRYWSHSKSNRIKYKLRHDTFDFASPFVGQIVLATARKALLAAYDKSYPVDLETGIDEHQGEARADNFQQLQNWLNLNLNHFEERLLMAEWEMQKKVIIIRRCIVVDLMNLPLQLLGRMLRIVKKKPIDGNLVR